MPYPDAQSIRAALKVAGVPHRYSIRRSRSPFGGPDRWRIELHASEVPAGVSLLYTGSSSGGSSYGSSDGGATAAKMEAVKRVFGCFMPEAS